MYKKQVVLFFVLMLLMVFSLPASAKPLGDNETEAAQIISLINGYRSENGLYQYVYNPVLAATALKHGEYQASIEESTHYSADGSRSSDRARDMGYGDGKYIFVSEMIYAGQYATPQAALAWWKNSPIHNGIMLSTDYHEIGVAVTRSDTRIYYTVNVGAVRGVTSEGVGSGGEVETAATSAPVATSQVDSSGGIYHIVAEGQTIGGVAEAYGVSEESLRLLNGLAENMVLTSGQLLLIQQPDDIDSDTVVVEDQQDADVPIDAAQTATMEAAPATSTPTPAEDDGIIIPKATATAILIVPTQNAAEEGGSNPFWIILIVILTLGMIGGAVFWYLRNQRGEEQDESDGEDAHTHDDEDAPSGAAFHHYSRQKQFDLLQEVAEVALRSYPLEVVHVEPLRYVLNAEFLVNARMEGGSGTVEQFVVRVNAPRFNSGVEIASELDWLKAVNEQTRINAPSPVRKRNGDWVKIVDLPNIDEPRHVVVFKYIPGKTIEMEASPAHLEVMGALIGLLHRHGAQQFEKPLGFVRIHWDTEGLKGGNLDVSAREAYNALTAHEREIVDEAEKLVGQAMKKIGRRKETFGLIHGDLHLKSILFHQGKPLILDFDTCGYGYYAYDLAVPIWNLFHRDDFAPLKTALLKGYRRVRPLSQEEESLLIHFVAGRLMSQILAWAGRRKHTNLSEMADEAIKKEVAQLEKLINLLER